MNNCTYFESITRLLAYQSFASVEKCTLVNKYFKIRQKKDKQSSDAILNAFFSVNKITLHERQFVLLEKIIIVFEHNPLSLFTWEEKFSLFTSNTLVW